MRRLFAPALLVMALGLGVLPAAHAADSPDLPDSASDRARAALAHAKGVMSGKVKGEATLALNNLFALKDSLEGREAMEASSILARPTDGASDTYGDGYEADARVRTFCKGHFCVHFDANSANADAPNLTDNNGNNWPDWVETVSQLMNTAWNAEVVNMGYRAPAPDGAYIKKGNPNKLMDVYLNDVTPQGILGYAAVEYYVGSYRKRASSFIVLDDDMAGNWQGPLPTLKATSAHEFFHTIQQNYDFKEDSWIMEATAQWMEEQVHDAVNDNRASLRNGQLGAPGAPLDSTGTAQYGNWIFFERLKRSFGAGVVKALWTRLDSTNPKTDAYSVQAIQGFLSGRGLRFANYYRDFAGTNLIPGKIYPEGTAYTAAPVAYSKTLESNARSTGVQGMKLNHLTSRNVQFNTGASLGTTYKRLRVMVNGPDLGTGTGAFIIVHRKDGTKALLGVPLNARGDSGYFYLMFNDAQVNRVTLTLSNGSSRYGCWKGTDWACQGNSLDNGRAFYFEAVAVA